uniref:Protein kinase domain-containing protein n=1 Tax=viral metagenome TaxID=1070528 RepID=A0A6C0F232_9ZZZZ
MSIPVNPPIIPPVIPVVDSDATSATSVSDGELKFKLFYQKPKNDNVLKDLEISQMGLKKCQNYIPIYSKFFSLNDTNYNSINLNQKHSAKTILACSALPCDDGVPKNCGNAIIFPNPNPKQEDSSSSASATTPVFFKFSPLLDPIKYLAGNYNFKGNAGAADGEVEGGVRSSSCYLDSLLSLPSIHSTPFSFDSATILRERSSPTPPPFTEGVVGGSTTTNSVNVEEGKKYNHYKILDTNNSAYVDGFFSYLSSQLLNTHGFIHGIDFYGSYLAIQDEFTINIIDDYDYLMKNDFFKEKNGTLFKFDETAFEDCSDDDDDDDKNSGEKKKQTRNRNRNPKLNIIQDKNSDDVQFDIYVDIFDNKEKEDKEDSLAKVELTELTELTDSHIFNPKSSEEYNINNMSCNSSSSSVSCSSRSSHTTTDNDNNDDSARLSDDDESDRNSKSDDSNNKSDDSNSNSDDSDSSGDTESTFKTIDDDDDYEEEEILNAVIYKFPVEVIMLERCTKTLDWLMVNDILSDGEWEAALMQIVMTLATYQKIFSFTHNDLHTNNVMFIDTEKEYIYYFFNKKYYKVPTFGRIFKIIDFGRSIYKFNSTLVCSDSFHKSGDAATQYNCEPYLNDKKPCIQPNFSFDLCRLGCSLFDFFIENMEDVARECKKNRLVSLIVDWVTDDEGRNILYKKDGVDRYPDFKLYKMIARTVHNKVPSQQLKHRVFTQYEVTQKSIKNVTKTEIINIDKFPVYI